MAAAQWCYHCLCVAPLEGANVRLIASDLFCPYRLFACLWILIIASFMRVSDINVSISYKRKEKLRKG